MYPVGDAPDILGWFCRVSGLDDLSRSIFGGEEPTPKTKTVSNPQPLNQSDRELLLQRRIERLERENSELKREVSDLEDEVEDSRRTIVVIHD